MGNVESPAAHRNHFLGSKLHKLLSCYCFTNLGVYCIWNVVSHRRRKAVSFPLCISGLGSFLTRFIIIRSRSPENGKVVRNEWRVDWKNVKHRCNVFRLVQPHPSSFKLTIEVLWISAIGRKWDRECALGDMVAVASPCLQFYNICSRRKLKRSLGHTHSRCEVSLFMAKWNRPIGM